MHNIIKISPKGSSFIKQHEGKVLRAYKDTAGIWTIGYGHTSAAGPPNVTPNMRLTSNEVNKLFNHDIQKYANDIITTFPTKNQNIFDGSVSFHYNTGAIAKASWVKLFKSGADRRSEISLNKWVRSGGKITPGLVRRRREEADIIFRNKYPAIQRGANIVRVTIQDQEIHEAQTILQNKGFYASTIDGLLGPHTKAAVLEYQKTHPNLSNDGILGMATLAQLRRDAEFFKRSSKSILTKGAFAPVIGWLSSFFSQYGIFITLGIGAVVVVVVLYQRRETILRRVNKFLNREVE